MNDPAQEAQALLRQAKGDDVPGAVVERLSLLAIGHALLAVREELAALTDELKAEHPYDA